MQENSSLELPQEFVAMRDVNVARDGSVVLHDVHLEIETGEHVAILGPNGCGKSTLIKTINCECYPIAIPGMVRRVYGRDRWDLTELRKHLGVVAPELPGRRTPHTRGLDAVLSGFFSSSAIWPNLQIEGEMRHAAEEALEMLEAAHLANRLVGQMSAGEVRRVMIARALVHKPAMLLLDEPSNALDLAAQRELREILGNLARGNQGHKTGIIMVTHHLADILPEMKRVIMMRHGRIVADGSKADLLTGKRLEELFGTPVTLTERNGYWHSW